MRPHHRHPGRRRPAIERARSVGRRQLGHAGAAAAGAAGGRAGRRGVQALRRRAPLPPLLPHRPGAPAHGRGARPAARCRLERGARARHLEPGRARRRGGAGLTKAALTFCVALLLLPALAISAATGGINLSTPSNSALADIPPDYLLLYQQAGLAFDVPWEVLAAIGKVECDHGRYPHPACWQQGAENQAGAGGPMQFLASTWRRYGIDADQNGVADRWNPADAVVSAANYLAAPGAPDDLKGATYAYNPSPAYVATVLAWAERYQEAFAEGTTAPVDVGALPALGDPAALERAVLSNPNIELRPEAEADVQAGRVDPRVLAALLALSQHFSLAGVGPFVSGHSYYVAGTNRPSNHAFGRAVDIGSIDGELVSPSNGAARQAALALAALPAPLRPDEIGSPFAELEA
ncbi:MAG: transglycosylase SLT domain-containing protein, partial [Solirubrobacterales bacterium]|nr:transglycosylase SLT domain-containing protein [Solirubrobacterales bacterium]